MANVQYYDVILKPVVTEKSMELMGEKKYTFLVHPEATKSQIKEAVEKMFTGTKVEKVNTMNNDGKDVIIKEKSQLDTAEAELRKNIELSTSREEKTISTLLYLVSNMIQTEQLTLL